MTKPHPLFGQSLGFPGEVWINTGGSHERDWHYFCEPAPGYVALIEPDEAGSFVLLIYRDSPQFAEARRTIRGQYLYVSTYGGEEIPDACNDSVDLLMAVALIQDFANRHKQEAA